MSICVRAGAAEPLLPFTDGMIGPSRVTAEESAEVMRTVAIAALGGLLLISLVTPLRRRRHRA
jgi:hypothetical protein